MFKRMTPLAFAAASAISCIAGASLIIPASPAEARQARHRTCGADSYINARGNCVHRPVRAPRAPSGATAKCRDGTYSFSQNHRGTCSHHGGVAAWL